MPRPLGSISLRLSVSFSIVLAAFAAAILVALYHLDEAKGAVHEIELSQSNQRDAARVVSLAEEMLSCQSDLVYPEVPGVDKFEHFQALSQEMPTVLRRLRQRACPRGDSGVVDRLSADAVNLSDNTRDMWDMRWTAWAVHERAIPLEILSKLRELHEESRRLLMRVQNEHSLLADILASRTLASVEQSQAAWERSVSVARLVFAIGMLAGFLTIYLTHKSFVRPIQAFIDSTQALGRGELDTRISPTGAPELIDLAHGFNRMARAVAANQSRLVDAERLAGVGRIAAGVAHEINNPLTVILGHAKILLARMPEGAPEREQLEEIAEETRQCKSIVSSLLDLSRPHDLAPGENVNAHEVVAEAISMLQALGLTEGVEVHSSVIERELPLTISRGRLRQLVLNVMRNALEVLQELRDGYLRIEGYTRLRTKLSEDMIKGASAEAKSFLVLVLTDNGPGIPPRTLARLFEPFFTTKVSGTGLGLAISYNIARAHGGFIDVETAPAEGTTFTIGLPLSGDE
jgi:signal transduction histidine kinase